MLSYTHFLVLSALLFAIGIYGVLSRRNLVALLMSIEVMLNAVLVNFVAAGRFMDNVQGDLFALFIVAIAAAEVVIGLAIFLAVFRNTGRVETAVLEEIRE